VCRWGLQRPPPRQGCRGGRPNDHRRVVRCADPDPPSTAARAALLLTVTGVVGLARFLACGAVRREPSIRDERRLRRPRATAVPPVADVGLGTTRGACRRRSRPRSTRRRPSAPDRPPARAGRRSPGPRTAEAGDPYGTHARPQGLRWHGRTGAGGAGRHAASRITEASHERGRRRWVLVGYGPDRRVRRDASGGVSTRHRRTTAAAPAGPRPRRRRRSPRALPASGA
jgi:hypothetical protein